MRMDAVDPDSAAYQLGAVMFYVVMFGLAAWLVIWGLRQRSGAKKSAGEVKIAIGACVALLALAAGLVRVVGPDLADRDSATTRVAEERESLQHAVDSARRYLETRQYLRVRGTALDGGKIDFSYRGDDSVGSLDAKKNSLRFVHVGDRTFIKPSEDFWKAQGSDADAANVIDYLDGRWIEIDTDDANFKDLITVTERSWLTKNLTTKAAYLKGKPKTIRGVPCIAVKLGASGGILYLARDDSRLMRFVDLVGEVDDVYYDRKVPAPKVPDRIIAGDDLFG